MRSLAVVLEHQCCSILPLPQSGCPLLLSPPPPPPNLLQKEKGSAQSSPGELHSGSRMKSMSLGERFVFCHLGDVDDRR